MEAGGTNYFLILLFNVAFSIGCYQIAKNKGLTSGLWQCRGSY